MSQANGDASGRLAASVSRRALFLATMITWLPSAVSCLAASSPMPVPAPVTRTVFPVSLIGFPSLSELRLGRRRRFQPEGCDRPVQERFRAGRQSVVDDSPGVPLGILARVPALDHIQRGGLVGRRE